MEIYNLCLSDIPKDKIYKSEKNGKSYISLVATDLREKDQFGNSKTVYISQTKEEKEAKKDKIYIGKGKVYTFEQKTPNATPVPNEVPEDPTDDLPF